MQSQLNANGANHSGLPQRRVTLFTLGGTIASVRSQDADGVLPRLTAADLIHAVPQLAAVAEVRAVTFRQLPSVDLRLPDVLALAAEIRQELASGVDGVVVTQGTDTLEETAFLLDCLVDGDAPVVVTGAMRNPELPGADGPANLLAAVQVAASESCRGLGTVVVMNDEIHAAQCVKKTNTASPATFQSPGTGPLGWVVEGRPRVILQPRQRWRLPVPADAPPAPVALVRLGLGDDGWLLQAVAELPYQGVVVEACGGGHVPSWTVDTLASLAQRVPVVLASRTGSGDVLQSTYGFPGSERDLLARGLVPAGRLDGVKARLLLQLLLMRGASRSDMEAALRA
ncbi:MAG: asparaginase [Alicyclobacillus sp.]|nr:asparaginase [Alicyclobacillus sp.]